MLLPETSEHFLSTLFYCVGCYGQYGFSYKYLKSLEIFSQNLKFHVTLGVVLCDGTRYSRREGEENEQKLSADVDSKNFEIADNLRQ